MRDAEQMASDAEKEIEINLRNAAEKAWGAVARATDALLLKYTREEPDPRLRTDRFRDLVEKNPELLALNDTYHAKMALLHGDCFYLNKCPPEATIKRIIRAKDYIAEVRRRVF